MNASPPVTRRSVKRIRRTQSDAILKTINTTTLCAHTHAHTRSVFTIAFNFTFFTLIFFPFFSMPDAHSNSIQNTILSMHSRAEHFSEIGQRIRNYFQLGIFGVFLGQA